MSGKVDNAVAAPDERPVLATTVTAAHRPGQAPPSQPDSSRMARSTAQRPGQAPSPAPGSSRPARLEGSGAATLSVDETPRGPAAPASLRQRTLDLDGKVRELAMRQHGVASRGQLLGGGLPAYVIDHRLARGRMQRLHRGVYRLGLLPLPREREMAAVLSCGASAVLSHGSAGVLWELVPARGPRAVVEVSLRTGHRPSVAGLRVHRVSRLPAEEVTLVDGIPVTVPSRTLVDLAGQLDSRALEQALAQAERLGLVTRGEIAQTSARHGRYRGAAILRALLTADAEPAFARSEAESRFLALIRKAQLRSPETNVSIRRYEVDFLWRSERLVVEIDGFAYHSSAAAFERDRRRDAVLAAAGYRVLRVTWRQLSREHEAVLARVAQVLVAALPVP